MQCALPYSSAQCITALLADTRKCIHTCIERDDYKLVLISTAPIPRTVVSRIKGMTCIEA